MIGRNPAITADIRTCRISAAEKREELADVLRDPADAGRSPARVELVESDIDERALAAVHGRPALAHRTRGQASPIDANRQ